MPASSSPVPAPRGNVGRHAQEGGAAVAAAALALGAQSSTALSRLVPALLSMAVGGHLAQFEGETINWHVAQRAGLTAAGGGRAGVECGFLRPSRRRAALRPICSGRGSAGQAAIQQQQSEVGGMTGGLGGIGTPTEGEGMNRSVAVSN
ncbi:hypothetical protein [Streptomyces spongiae]|uniref:Uncharacterized protein n=1 Tax=Streptomyces spongiae TaxID=565072 RepID=A0A5N8XJD6_9ACTN|nr:hypothetical protein [Streptomyces spongiae]MPY59098.1 hypothetical protein [Streptomyces spongiae]